jgi:hypothetical protein
MTDPCPYHDRSAPHGVVDGLPQVTNGTRRVAAPLCGCGGGCTCHHSPVVCRACVHDTEET